MHVDPLPPLPAPAGGGEAGGDGGRRGADRTQQG
eukprot:gene9687-7633_t